MRKDKQNGIYKQIQRDAIQITFAEVALIWDLKNNTEISTLERLTEFGTEEHHARTGFRYFRVKSGNK